MDRETVHVGKTNTAILRGDDDLAQWTDEELMRGQRKGRNGRWTGRKPKVVPYAVHEELTRRRLSKAYELLRDNLVTAVEVLIDIATDKDAPPAVQLRAAEIVMERVMPKQPVQIELRRSKFDEFMDKVVFTYDEGDAVPQHERANNIIDVTPQLQERSEH
jgi:hypothetical protein